MTDVDVWLPSDFGNSEDLGNLFFQELGVFAEVHHKRGDLTAEHVILVVAMKPFLDGAMAALGASTAIALQHLAKRLGRPVRMTDSRTGVSVELDRAALRSGRALAQMAELDLQNLPRKTILSWDEDGDKWVSRNNSK